MKNISYVVILAKTGIHGFQKIGATKDTKNTKSNKVK